MRHGDYLAHFVEMPNVSRVFRYTRRGVPQGARARFRKGVKDELSKSIMNLFQKHLLGRRMKLPCKVIIEAQLYHVPNFTKQHKAGVSL